MNIAKWLKNSYCLFLYLLVNHTGMKFVIFYYKVIDVARWLSASRLRLNPAKAVLMWLGSRQQVEKIIEHQVRILVVVRHNRGHSAGPWRHYGPSSHDVGACQLRGSRSILLPAPATSSRVIGVGWCGQDSSPRVHLVAFRLLQLSYTATLSAPALIGRTECCSRLGHWHLYSVLSANGRYRRTRRPCPVSERFRKAIASSD